MRLLSARSIARVGAALALLLALLAAQVTPARVLAFGLTDSLAPCCSGSVTLWPYAPSVMHSTTTYAIFWKQVDLSGDGMTFYYEAPRCYGPGCISDYATDTDYKNLNTRFLTDVGGTTYYGLLTQYWAPDSNKQPVPVFNESTYGGSWEDNSNLPNLSRGNPGATVYDSDIHAEIQKAIQQNGWTVDDSSLFFVYLPEEVQSCDPNNNCSNTISYNGDFCGYHQSFTTADNKRVHYAVIPDPGASAVCDYNITSPNSNIVADEAINITSHELFEAVTDSGGGWANWSTSPADEIADKCHTDFPNRGGALGSNLTIGGHEYIVQSEWSALDGACELGHTPIPYLTGLDPATAQTSGTGQTLGGDLTLTVNGHNFTSASTVQWNGTALTTSYVSSKQLQATVPAADLVNPGTSASITVNTPGGGTSNAQTFYITQNSVTLTNVQTQTGSDLNLTLGTAPATVSVTANGGPGTISLAQYSANPVTASTTAASTNAFADVYVGSGSSFSSVTIVDCNLNGGSQVQWYNPATQTWAPASNQSYDPSTGCATVTVDSTTTPSLAQLTGTGLGAVNQPPSWVATPDQTQDYHDTLSFGLKATDPEPGDRLKLTLAGGSSLLDGLNLTDNGDGTGTVAGTLQAKAGDYPVTFDVSDGVNPAVPQTVTIHVKHEETVLTYTGAPLIANNRPATLSAILKEDGSSAPVPAGQTVTLALGSGAQSCQAQTAADGTVSCQIATVSQPLGKQPVSANFAGDSHYAASSDSSQQRLVFSYLPAGGGFALGDKTVAAATSGTTATWWGSQWSTLNSLSGGSAPTSFKGFAQTFYNGKSAVTDPVCGGTWTTTMGNSSVPPGTVPAYMAVVVPSQATQSGTTTIKISGNIAKVVIVKTNPSYKPDPAYPGTGTVVATLCGS